MKRRVRQLTIVRSVESPTSIQKSLGGSKLLDFLEELDAHALCKSPPRRSNVLRGPVWPSVFPAGGSHEASAERALRGAWDAHGLDSFNEVFNRHDADAMTGTLNRRCAE